MKIARHIKIPGTDSYVPYPQGDVLFRKIDRLPESVGVDVPRVGGKIVVAHSETGHDHAITGAPNTRLLSGGGSGLVCYLQVEDAYADVVHHRPHDTHETIRLPGGGAIYEVRRQREHAPEGWRRVED